MPQKLSTAKSNSTAANHFSNQKTRNHTLILKELLKPAVKEVIVGVGDKAKKIGGKLVMYRHEFTYKNPTAIAIDVTDEMSDQRNCFTRPKNR